MSRFSAHSRVLLAHESAGGSLIWKLDLFVFNSSTEGEILFPAGEAKGIRALRGLEEKPWKFEGVS